MLKYDFFVYVWDSPAYIFSCLIFLVLSFVVYLECEITIQVPGGLWSGIALRQQDFFLVQQTMSKIFFGGSGTPIVSAWWGIVLQHDSNVSCLF